MVRKNLQILWSQVYVSLSMFVLGCHKQSLTQLTCSYEAENQTRSLVCDLGNPMKSGTSVSGQSWTNFFLNSKSNGALLFWRELPMLLKQYGTSVLLIVGFCMSVQLSVFPNYVVWPSVCVFMTDCLSDRSEVSVSLVSLWLIVCLLCGSSQLWAGLRFTVPRLKDTYNTVQFELQIRR